MWCDTIRDTNRDKLVANEASEMMTTHVVRTASFAARAPGVRGADACAPSATDAGKGAAHEDQEEHKPEHGHRGVLHPRPVCRNGMGRGSPIIQKTSRKIEAGKGCTKRTHQTGSARCGNGVHSARAHTHASTRARVPWVRPSAHPLLARRSHPSPFTPLPHPSLHACPTPPRRAGFWFPSK